MHRDLKNTIEVKNLSTGYRLDKGIKQVASSLNLRLNQGSLVAVMGPNGSGKSTLIRTICNLQEALSGEIFLDGKPINNFSQAQLAQHIAVVLTDSIANENMTVYELVALGRHPHTSWLGRLEERDRAIIASSLEDVGMLNYEQRPMYSLSDGEKQRVMIARALAQESRVIILDEPTAHLDIVHRYGIMTLLRNLAQKKNKAILLSIHELDLALQSADYLWLLHKKEAHVGRPEDFILNGLLQKVFQNDKLEFNVRTGSFKMKYPNLHPIRISIENDDIRHWTSVFLNKNEFEIVDDSAVNVSYNQGFWSVGEECFPDLDSLMTYLKRSFSDFY